MGIARLSALLFVCSVYGACGGDGASTSSEKASGPAPGADAGAASDNAFANIDCDPAGDGVCENDTDCEQVESGNAREWAVNCGTSCLGTADEAGCSRACIQKQAGLTETCGECYVEMSVCSREFCLPPCLMEPESRDCFDCQVENGCRDTFDMCSGLPRATSE